MNIITVRFPAQVTFGNGCIKNFIDDYSKLGLKRLFVVTFPEILPKLEQHFKTLKKNHIDIFIDTSIKTEPTYNSFTEVWSRAKEFKADSVVGIGGGSSLDVAKLVAALINQKKSIARIVDAGTLSGRNMYLACLPTTAGTGSEVSPNAILLDDKENLKKAVVSPFLIPDASYVDPQLTHSVPPKVTAATGMDALTHCIEEYTNLFSHPVIDNFALEGIRLIGKYLPEAYRNGENTEAREKVALGSLYGGFGLGPVNTAAVHALSYPLGSNFHVPHGLSNALLLPYIMKFNIHAIPERYAHVALALGAEEQTSDLVTAEKGVEKVFTLCRTLDIPLKMSELKIPKEAIESMVEEAMKVTRLLKNNPRPITMEDARDIYNEAY